MLQRRHVPGLLVPAAVKSQVGLYSGFCYLHMKYSYSSLKARSTDVNHQADRSRRVGLFLPDTSISHGGVQQVLQDAKAELN